MPPAHGALLVIGSGPGIGQHVAIAFAERGFSEIILMSRNNNRLPKDAAAVRSDCNNVCVDEIVADCADADSVGTALKAADRSLGQTPLECVLCNSARPGSSHFFDFEAERLEADLQVSHASWEFWRKVLIFDWRFRYVSLAYTPSPNGQCPSSSTWQAPVRRRHHQSWSPAACW